MKIQSIVSIPPSFFDTYSYFHYGTLSGFCCPELGILLESGTADFLCETAPNASIIKKGHNVVFQIPVSQQGPGLFSHVVVKKCRNRNRINFLFSPLVPSKARKSFYVARYLITHNCDTPLPLAYIERKKWGFVTESYYITEAISDGIKVKALVNHPDTTHDGMHALLAAVVEYAQKMHGAGMIHRDFNLANLLLCGQDYHKRLVLVDLNRSRIRRKPLSAFARVNDISRLYWGKHRQEFFRMYSRGDTKIVRWRWFFDVYYHWRKKRRLVKDWIKGK